MKLEKPIALLGSVALVALPLAVWEAAPASAAVATPQWMTAVTGTIATGGVATFGTSGETATISAPTGGSTCVGGDSLEETPTQLTNFGAATYLSLPSNAAGVAACSSGGANVQTVTLNEPLINPTFYVDNLDDSYLDISALAPGGAVSLTSVLQNPALLLENSAGTVSNPGTRLIDGSGTGGAQGTCATPLPPSYPTCGAFTMSDASQPNGQVSGFTLTNTNRGGNDGWAWLMSFPAASLTPSLTSATIGPGGQTQLTFTIANPTTTPLTPMGFTNTLPSGLTLADGNVTNNGNCGTPAPTLTDASSNPLANGSTSVMAGGISVAAGATCTITVDVTASATATYTDASTAFTTTVGNLVPDGSTAVTVNPAAPTVVDLTGTTAGTTPVSTDPTSANNGNHANGTATLMPTSVELIDPSSGNPSKSVTTADGTYAVDPTTGLITFTPNGTFTGTTPPIDYTITDSAGNTAEATLTETIAPAAGTPIADPKAAAAAAAVLALGGFGFLFHRRRTN